MKKITFLVLLLLGTVTLAQEIDIIDRPSDVNTAVISVESDDGTGVYVADSFTTTEDLGLNSITLHGFYSNGSGVNFTTAFNIIIYANNEGTPGTNFQPQIAGTGVIELKGITSDNYVITTEGTKTLITVDLASANSGESPTLVAGTYWMVCYPSITGSPTDEGRWNWHLSSTVAPLETLLIDPQNLFGAGATNWSSVGNLIGDTANSFAWTLKGSPALSVNENKLAQLSIFPNPAQDVIRIKMPSHIETTQVSLYNVLGKQINAIMVNNQINVSHLSKGLYILNLETTAGTLTEKLIIE
ncbi:T9SS type A sorting domain-containing protein [Gelidibacter japonicus]|uniref:T9SS type A sorting domain-containing protein n=1 Tax=Gelidibacter japonicus TaxID=1962232 RepID=UPI0020208370|nr:T9SS type A sorting domain-containing protein [Gelidibacter japonicus]MCL8008870.1 T9SS type A sorting domain-containing protein [Gelidibacter japonicus]